MTTPDVRPDTQRVLDSIRKIVRELRVAARAAESELGVTAAQLFVLQRLAELERPTVGALAERTFTDQSSVSVAVKRLAEAGLATRTRSPEDERRVELAVTTRGRALLRRAPEPPQGRLVEALSALGPAKRKTLAGLLEEVTSHMGLADEKAELFFEDEHKAAAKRRKSDV